MEETTNEVEAPKQEVETEFKKPVLIGRIGKLPKKAKVEVERVSQENQKAETSPKVPEPSPKSSLPPAVLLKEISTPIPYKEPKWSGLCPDGSDYALEVLKSGMIVDKVDLTTKSYYVFGRLANSDVVLAHPTISRHHAVLQYKAFAEADEPPSGWYIFDLSSTHGTHLNRERLKPQHYTRIRVGHQIKFGNSSRTYIVLGPDFDCEGESELTVTEIKKRADNMKQERERMIREAVEQRERDRAEEERKKEEQGIDWGMGEDAEEEPDLADNPYATTNNEELFIQDPKKTLRGYFEREGHELSYDCEERGPGQFLCRVELPIEDARGQPVIAEALHRGKKKEAVVACALAACRALDRAGVLRQATHEPRRRKQPDRNADDYYDSDDDTFLDRTGTVESKRDRRRGDKQRQEPLTYDTLLEQIKELEGRLGSEQACLARLRAAAARSAPADMDDYMQALPQGGTMAHKAEISKTRMSISKLQAELASRRRLAALARPAAPPALAAPLLKSSNSVVYGKRIRLKEDKKPKPKPQKQEEKEFVEEMDSDEEPEPTKKQTTDKPDEDMAIDNTELSIDNKEPSTDNKEQTIDNKERSIDNKETSIDNTEQSIDNPSSDTTQTEVKATKESKRVFGPMRPPENYVVPESYFNQESDRDLPEITED